MSKLARTSLRPAPARGVLKTNSTDLPDTVNDAGGVAFSRDVKSELFTLAVSNLVGEDTFYEKAQARDERFRVLIAQATAEDPAWTAKLLAWLRSEGNLRSASIVGAVEYGRAWSARFDTDPSYGSRGPAAPRQVLASVMQRADEPGEALGYWLGRYGRPLPKWLKKALYDGARSLYAPYCVVPETFVLTTDLTWKQAGDLTYDDVLIGFDENLGIGNGHRSASMQRSKIEVLGRADLPCYRVITDKGETVVSDGHQFVVRTGTRNRAWRRTDQIKTGDVLTWACSPWGESENARDAGYMAGLFDGEGFLYGRMGARGLGMAQNPGAVLDEAVAAMKRLGFEVNVRTKSSQTCMNLNVAGGKFEVLRALGQLRPVRLLARSTETWEGGYLLSKGPWCEPGKSAATVLSVEPVGVKTVVTMQTSTRTFIADGFLAHNSTFKYDGQGQPVRFGDVVELSQGPEDTRLFKWLLDRRHGREEGDYGIEMLKARRRLESMPVAHRRALIERGAYAVTPVLQQAGMTWESVSGWIQGPMDAKVWEAVIPTMGYMALLRNLRNFDEAGVSDKVAVHVIARLTDPEQVAKSRQLPFRFLSAYKQVPSDRWKHPLGQALDLSFGNIPQLGGKTLVLIDVSGSMQSPISGRSTIAAWEIAALFGIALARSQRQQATIVGFDDATHPFELRRGANVLSELQRFRSLVRGGATYTEQAVRQYQAGHDRVVVISDEQQNGRWRAEAGGVFASLPRATHAYTINVMGYADAHAPATGVRHGLAGLTDAVFKLMGALEARQAGRWPWEI